MHEVPSIIARAALFCQRERLVEYNEDKIDEATLALMSLVMWEDKWGHRAWKSFHWDTMNRLHEKGWIHDPKSKSKSVAMTEEGAKRAEELFGNLFAKVDFACCYPKAYLPTNHGVLLAQTVSAAQQPIGLIHPLLSITQ